ncbi:MAG TPA: hypothetical protein VMT24_15575, partial [Aggregatilineaceae bacterium]|nr:hypothetical protein [Aggregatilineaceae bacterium]
FENAVRFLYADDTLHARICYPNLGTWGEWHDRCQLGDGQVRIEGGGSKSAIIQPYETVLAFRYSPTAGADLLAQFPSVYRPGQASASYDPRKVMAASGTPPRRASTLFDSWSIPASQAEDTPIVDGETIGLGSSWYPPESDASGTFQWIDNDAEFIIGARAEPTAILSLELEPGPGLAYQPFTFRVLNSDGQRVAVGRVHTHQTVQLILPLEPDRATLFRLHVDAGGQKIPSDSRILNFRVFKMSVLSAVASDQR